MLKLQERCGPEDDLALLRIPHVANDAARVSLALQVDGARKAGCTWADIGTVLGISRQAAEQRFGKAPKAVPRFTAPDRQPPVNSAEPPVLRLLRSAE